MMATMTALHDEVMEWEQELVATRRDLHMHPEVGFEVTRTAGSWRNGCAPSTSMK